MKILKIKLEIFNHKYFSKINVDDASTRMRRMCVESTYLLIGGFRARTARLPGLGWAGLGQRPSSRE